MTPGSKPALATAVIAAALIFGGCDQAQYQADKTVENDLADAQIAAMSDQDNAAETARSKFAEAANNSEASQGIRAQAKAALAQAEFEAARATMGKINRAELQLANLTWEISQLAQQIRISGAAVEGYRKYDPKPARDAIASRIAEAQGGQDKAAWFTHGAAVIPTLSASKQEVARLEGELSQRNEQLTSLTQQRSRLLDEAEQAAGQADQLKGQQALEPFKHASDLRKQAGDLAVQIDTLKNEIKQRQSNLAVAQGQMAAVSDVITQLQDQSASLDKTWKDIDVQAANHQKLSSEILGSAAAGADPAAIAASAVAGSIAQKAAAVDTLVQDLQKLRSDAVVSLNDASTHFDDAYSAATQMNIQLRQQIDDPKNANRPEIAAWKNMVAVLNPMQFRFAQAGVKRMLGELYASEAVSLTSRIDLRDLLSQTLQGAGLTVPASLQGAELNQKRQDAYNTADAAFKDSDDQLTSIVDGVSPEDLRTTARIDRALTFYEWAQLARVAGNEAMAKDRIGSAARERNTAAEANLTLVPPMPAELGPIPKPAPPTPEAPASQPTETTATAPAEAPATEPAAAPAAAVPTPAEPAQPPPP